MSRPVGHLRRWYAPIEPRRYRGVAKVILASGQRRREDLEDKHSPTGLGPHPRVGTRRYLSPRSPRNRRPWASVPNCSRWVFNSAVSSAGTAPPPPWRGV